MTNDERVQKLLDTIHSGKTICGKRTNLRIQSTLEHDVRCYWWTSHNSYVRAGLNKATMMELITLNEDWITL